MQKKGFLIACLFICAGCIAQEYPFVHYTPKDGLISNLIRSIYQDTKGRLYFTSLNGLSVYDGSRFINYTPKTGLSHDIVNCVMEMGDDSIWIITNSGKINYLVDGRLRTLALQDSIPVINNLFRDEKGTLYAATDQGLNFFDQGRFIKLPFIDSKGKDVNTFLIYIVMAGNYLLVQRDNSIVPGQRNLMYLYNKVTKKITDEAEQIYGFNKAPDGRIWVSTEKSIMAVDTIELQKGKIILKQLPSGFDKLKTLGGSSIVFDREGNGWFGDGNTVIKADANGHITSFTTASGLSMSYINYVFMDREGITWIATNAGVDKLIRSNLSFSENPFGFSSLNDISYNKNKNELLLYSVKDANAAIVKENKKIRQYRIKSGYELNQLIETPYGVFGVSANTICKVALSGNVLYPEVIVRDSTAGYGNSFADKNGNLIVAGKFNLTAIVNGKTVCRKKLNDFADHMALDSKGNIWVATRAGELIMYEAHPADPSNYLEQKKHFVKELSGFSPRSIVIDTNDNIWIGSRVHGIHVFGIENEILTKRFHITAASGLSDDFTTNLACDFNNNIWASSPSGLDKIAVKNGTPVIENLTRQNNIYQKASKIIIDKNNEAWGLLSNGLIRITPENKKPAGYSPALIVSMMKAGNDTITNMNGTLSYKQNNLSFYFAATSFLDEKQILYSYRLHGGSNTQWSEPSNNAIVSLIDLPPGDYTLDIKANFPAGRYPEQVIHYRFSIAPPWWQTWWFRLAAGLLITGLLIVIIRFYYRRKLEKQKTILEKQQAIEKERTRIATDMHDDLGAGLSRIKFLSQALSNKDANDENIKSGLEKITGYSDEMTEKMGEIVWALNEKNDTLADLVAYTRSYTVEYLANHNIQCNANTPLHLPGTFIPGEIRRNIFLAVKESLHNVVKHANAAQVHFSVELTDRIQIIIHDNGKGIDWNNQRPYSNGLQNIQKRMKEIKGKADFLNEKGTKVLLSVPLNL